MHRPAEGDPALRERALDPVEQAQLDRRRVRREHRDVDALVGDVDTEAGRPTGRGGRTHPDIVRDARDACGSGVLPVHVSRGCPSAPRHSGPARLPREVTFRA
ncbi:hypothetical protein CBZ_26120 [Cellulomonas biazotea]|uniref:Uncharacterized protein n=1 Tax=Cellulomonas biazotea TaxID=1709 RepID=A0A402DU06_9CELL|nr:hypothetical protein CBZ_26120 [Cellulomonas biazotea]